MTDHKVIDSNNYLWDYELLCNNIASGESEKRFLFDKNQKGKIYFCPLCGKGIRNLTA